ncbi:MAG TPA: malto-oligosyltrehalose trehalohydrolase [Polyangia bacterium]|nr:malto-oligosyltrehalose trehalohydrolase [Polyangia bacterium]
MTGFKNPSPAPLLGARVAAGGARFGVYTTTARRCAVRLYGPEGQVLGTHDLAPAAGAVAGHYEVEVPGAGHGTLYQFVLDDRELPDPYARFLPEGVHGPAMVYESRYVWRHGEGVARPLSEHVLYELHVGTFTERGTYAGVRERLSDLVALGVTTIEIMPVAAFSGQRGWGYDGVALYAPFAPYGEPDELRRLVDEAHRAGLAVLLDVVYNHFGPSGNYLTAYSPDYFTSAVRNAWGDAPNYAHPAMRRYVLDNARYWLGEFRFDGLRLDATHAITDPNQAPRHILRELADEVERRFPGRLLIAEDDRNEAKLVRETGLDALWADDFHHAVRVSLTHERDGYYAAYEPGPKTIAETIEGGWLYQGQIYPPRGEPRGSSAAGLPAEAFVYCIQNHDQIGNRALGDRLTESVSIDAYCAASTLLLFLPMTPLLFMGQEWAASSPFQYFTDHEEELGHAVSAGRREEFKHFRAFSDPAARARIPDPQAEETFLRSRLQWSERSQGEHVRVLALHRQLLALRRKDPVLSRPSRERLEARADGQVLVVRRWNEAGSTGARAKAHAEERWLLVHFGPGTVPLSALGLPDGQTRLLLRSDLGTDFGDHLPGDMAFLLAVSPI